MPDAGPSLATRTRPLEPRLRMARRAPSAEVSRARGRSAFTARRLPSGSARERPVDESFTPTRSARTPPVARSGRTRGRVWCSAAAVPAAPERVRNRLVRYASDDHAARAPVRVRVAPRPAFAGSARAEGRFPRASAKRSEIGCTRGAFHRRATRTWAPGFRPVRRSGGALSTDCHQPVENTRRRCTVASNWQTHAPARLP
jgi:hypothetical protein